jgi:hypothetical protein
MEAVALVGLAILIGLLLVLPVLGAQLGIDLSVVSRVLEVSTGTAHRAGAAMARNEHATPLARFVLFGLPHHPARQPTTPTATSESRKGLSGANPRHCGLTGPARDATGIAATLICLCLRVFHNHLRRGSAALGPRYEPWGYRLNSARPPHDP